MAGLEEHQLLLPLLLRLLLRLLLGFCLLLLRLLLRRPLALGLRRPLPLLLLLLLLLRRLRLRLLRLRLCRLRLRLRLLFSLRRPLSSLRSPPSRSRLPPRPLRSSTLTANFLPEFFVGFVFISTSKRTRSPRVSFLMLRSMMESTCTKRSPVLASFGEMKP